MVSIAMFRKGRKSKLTVSGKEGDGSAVGTSTSSTSDTVDVVLGVVRVVVVQNVSDVANIFTMVSRRKLGFVQQLSSHGSVRERVKAAEFVAPADTALLCRLGAIQARDKMPILRGCIRVTRSLCFCPVGSLGGKTSLIGSSEDATSTLVSRERIRYKSGDTSIVEKKPLHDGSRLRRERKRTK